MVLTFFQTCKMSPKKEHFPVVLTASLVVISLLSLFKVGNSAAIGNVQGAVGTLRNHITQKTAQNTSCISWLFLS